MPVEILTAMVAIFVASVATLTADRGRYVADSRSFDLNFVQEVILERGQPRPNTHTETAKLWLRRSQDYRRMALYMTYSTVNMILATFFIGVSLLLDYVFPNDHYWICSTVISGVFFLFMIDGWLIKYRKKIIPDSSVAVIRGFVKFYEKFSFKVSRAFPPLLPPLDITHLERWPEVREAIAEYREFLDSLEFTPDLIRNDMEPDATSEYVKSKNNT